MSPIESQRLLLGKMTDMQQLAAAESIAPAASKYQDAASIYSVVLSRPLF